MAKKPEFGGPLQPAQYYKDVSAIISILRPYSTLRVIAAHLHSNGFLSPSGMPFNRMMVANFIRSPHYQPNSN